VDRLGKLWHFHAHLGKNISHDKLLTKFGFGSVRKSDKTLNLKCTKTNPAGGMCPFAGKYLKSNGCLYTRGEHDEHTKRSKKIFLKKVPQIIGENYIDRYGKLWKFNQEIGTNIHPRLFSSKFGFCGIKKSKPGLNLQCKKKGSNGKCKYIGVYLYSNGCLYTRGSHNHAHIEKVIRFEFAFLK